MYTIDTVIPFDLIIDTDLGLLKLIQYEYRSTDFFNLGILDSNNNTALQDLLITRQEKNPLSVIYKYPEDVATRDDLYKQFMEKQYSNILKLSPSSLLADMIRAVNATKDKIVRCTIACETDEQVQELHARGIKPFDIIVVKKGDIIDTKPFGSVYAKFISDLSRYGEFEGKVIYIANYFVNATPHPVTGETIVNPEILNYVSNNELRVFSIYSYKTSNIPKG